MSQKQRNDLLNKFANILQQFIKVTTWECVCKVSREELILTDRVIPRD